MKMVFHLQEVLIVPPPMLCTILNDESTISSNLTVDTCMDTIESNIVTTNTNVGNLDNLVNYLSHLLSKFMKEMKQGVNVSPAVFTTNINESKIMIPNKITKAADDNPSMPR